MRGRKKGSKFPNGYKKKKEIKLEEKVVVENSTTE